MAETKLNDMPAAQRDFVEQIAQYYFDNDGMPHERGRIIGWLIISDPCRQSAQEIVRRLDVDRADVDYIADKLVPAGVLTRQESTAEGSGDYYLEMGDTAWVNRMQEVFAKVPEFHAILAEGADLLAGASPERRRRVAGMERFFGYLATEIPGIFDRYRKTLQTSRA